MYLAQKQEIIKIYGYEPFPETFAQAENNLKLNPKLAEKISIFNIGLGGKNEVKEFHYSRELPGSMSTAVDKFPQNAETAKVQMRNAGEVLQPIFEANENIMLKMDCEGGEYEIIETLIAGGLLQKIKVIIMEWHFRKPDLLVQLLNANGFFCFCNHEIVNYQGIIRAVKM